MQIVTEINSIIEQKINIINPSGIIIASTDEARIGSYHEAAKQLVIGQMDELIVRNNEEYAGSKEGVNFPIVVRDETLGVIGVTGPYEEVFKYGQIIKRMTEILLLEASIKEEKALDESIRNRFIHEWMNGDIKHITNSFVDRGFMLGLDITVPRRIMIMSAFLQNGNEDMESLRTIDQAEEYLKRLIKRLDENNVFMKSTAYLLCAVSDRSDKEMLEFAQDIKMMIETRFPIRLAIGIDSRSNNYMFIHTSFVKANKALQSCLRTHIRDIRFYDDLNMEIFADDISDNVKQEFVHKIFKGYNNDKIAEAVRLLEVFYDEEGSITLAAEKLFIHKNTLQYKLKKLYEETGYDPRSIRHSSLFYIAIYFYREIRDLLVTEE